MWYYSQSYLYYMEKSKLTLLLHVCHSFIVFINVDDASQPDAQVNDEEEAAAIKIQSIFRMLLVIKELWFNQAATMIQSFVRKQKAKALLIILRESKASVKIQSFFRKQKAKALLISLRESKALAEASALALVDAAKDAKENEGEYIMCSFMFTVLSYLANLFFFHSFHTYHHRRWASSWAWE